MTLSDVGLNFGTDQVLVSDDKMVPSEREVLAFQFSRGWSGEKHMANSSLDR